MAAGQPLIRSINGIRLNVTVEAFLFEYQERLDNHMAREFWIGKRMYDQAKKRKLITRLDAKDVVTPPLHLKKQMNKGIKSITLIQHMYLVRLTALGKDTHKKWIISLALIGRL